MRCFIPLLLCVAATNCFADTKKLQTGAQQLINQPASSPVGLKAKHIALVANQSSVVGKTHLLELLLQQGLAVKTIFSPEHGFRGTADAGATVNNSVDPQTGVAVLSLYGKNKKPTAQALKDIDLLIFDRCTLLHLFINSALCDGSSCRAEYSAAGTRQTQPKWRLC